MALILLVTHRQTRRTIFVTQFQLVFFRLITQKLYMSAHNPFCCVCKALAGIVVCSIKKNTHGYMQVDLIHINIGEGNWCSSFVFHHRACSLFITAGGFLRYWCKFPDGWPNWGHHHLHALSRNIISKRSSWDSSVSRRTRARNRKHTLVINPALYPMVWNNRPNLL